MKWIASTAALMLLSACGSEPAIPPAENRAANVGAETPAAPPAPPAAEDKSALAPLTAEGWGPLRIGMTLAEVTAALGPDSDPEAVGGPDPESCDQFRPARAPAGMLVMIEDGRLTSIALIDASAIKSDRGLGIGATAADVEKTYGETLIREPHKYQDPPAAYLTWWAKGRKGKEIWVRDSEARGIRYELDGRGKVESVHAGGPSIQYVEGCA